VKAIEREIAAHEAEVDDNTQRRLVEEEEEE